MKSVVSGAHSSQSLGELKRIFTDLFIAFVYIELQLSYSPKESGQIRICPETGTLPSGEE
ncbi:MAG TPA: hypothetical protein VFP33_01610 [Gallionella sp.]|nr:hypothetical protein [Gallionella sp.]